MHYPPVLPGLPTTKKVSTPEGPIPKVP